MTSDLILKHIHTRLTYHFKSEKLIPPSHLGLAQGFLGHKVYFHHLFVANCNLLHIFFPPTPLRQSNTRPCAVER